MRKQLKNMAALPREPIVSNLTDPLLSAPNFSPILLWGCCLDCWWNNCNQFVKLGETIFQIKTYKLSYQFSLLFQIILCLLVYKENVFAQRNPSVSVVSVNRIPDGMTHHPTNYPLVRCAGALESGLRWAMLYDIWLDSIDRSLLFS